ncbi:MAG: O-antigen ligase family protein [Roseiflexaceae bacterium]
MMALALALFQLGGALLPALVGALLFGGLALLRPDLGLLFVPLTVPLYLIPAAIQGLRADADNPFRLPTYEVALLAVLGATLANWLWHRATTDHRPPTTDDRFHAIGKTQHATHITFYVSRFTFHVLRYAPQFLFLLAGALGVLLAAERVRALREFRWLIAEPLIFYTLLKLQLAGHGQPASEPGLEKRLGSSSSISQFSIFNSPFTLRLVAAFALSGALVGLLGLLQFAGLDLVPLLGRKQCFAPDGGPCTNIVADGGVRRVLSVYGHPNNLGLYLGRVWPLAAALAVAAWNKNESTTNKSAWLPAFFALCSLFSVGGIVVSFSRGAWLGAAAALAVLLLGAYAAFTRSPAHPLIRSPKQLLAAGRWLLAALVALMIIGGLALTLRGDVTAGSTPIRLLLWREAAGYIWRHPLGIGLDQFGYYHDPNSGQSLIDPALIGTSEQYAAHPHNLLLDIWLRLGPLGLLAFGWLLARFFRDAWRAARAPAASWPLALGALAAMVAALIHGLVDNFYFVPDLAIAFWLLLALTGDDERVSG